jgi:hypothetical protein
MVIHTTFLTDLDSLASSKQTCLQGTISSLCRCASTELQKNVFIEPEFLRSFSWLCVCVCVFVYYSLLITLEKIY